MDPERTELWPQFIRDTTTLVVPMYKLLFKHNPSIATSPYSVGRHPVMEAVLKSNPEKVWKVGHLNRNIPLIMFQSNNEASAWLQAPI